MATYPKQRLSTKVLNISLLVALVAVIFFGLTVFGIEYLSGLKDAQNDLNSNLSKLAGSISRELQKRQGRINLLTENPRALEAAVQSLKVSRNAELFFGSGVLYYEIMHGTRIESGGSTGFRFTPLQESPRHGALKVVELPDTQATAGVVAEAHAVMGDRPMSIRVLWNLTGLISAEELIRPNLFDGIAVVDERGNAIWTAGTPMPPGDLVAGGVTPREFTWDGQTWIGMSEEMSQFSEPVSIRAITPKSYLYAQAWRMSSKFLFRVIIIFFVGLFFVLLLAFAIRHAMKPLDGISQGVRQISEGNLETVLETGGDDEISFLAETLNEMTHRLKVKEQSVQAHIQLLKEKNDELLALSERLKEADRLKDQFLAVLSHELRTPLTAIIGYSDLFLEGIYGPLTPKQTENMSYLKSNGAKLLSLMEDLLDVAKIRAGSVEVNVEGFEVRDLMSDIRKFAENAIRPKPNVQYLEDIHEGMIPFRSDRVKIEQILTNLLSNAIKFTERGVVKITASPDGEGWVKFEVEDTGIGIAPQHMPKIFDAFVQLDAGIRRRYGGTGLGLTICKSLVEKLGGRIDVRSELGKGSRFTVSLPSEFRPVPAAAVEGPRS